MINTRIIKEYGLDPVNYGKIQNPSITYTEKDVSCGEFITIYIVLKNNIIEEITFEGDGRMIMIAAMSLMIIELEGEDFSKILTYNKDCIFKLLDVQSESLNAKSLKSSLLGLLALKNIYLKHINKEKIKLTDILSI